MDANRTTRNRLILGSASERRKHILEELGAAFEVLVPDTEELTYEDDPSRTVLENAILKNRRCVELLAARPAAGEAYVLTADTVVSFEGRCVGKPASLAEAAVFLRRFSGKPQAVFTGVALSRNGGATETAVV